MSKYLVEVYVGSATQEQNFTYECATAEEVQEWKNRFQMHEMPGNSITFKVTEI